MLRIRTNSPALGAQLRSYFEPFLVEPGRVNHEILLIECEPLAPLAGFRDWPREPGKSGRKDSFVDLPDGRLLRKVRTGMMFLQTGGERIAAGPCLDCFSQVVNFINSQYLNHLQQHGWLLCHAAALADDSGVFAIAGSSAGGKSTMMLQLLGNPGMRYVTNDRLLIRRGSGPVQARGIPKWPRINPGTIVGNPRLHGLARSEQLAEWRGLPAAELWHLEEKHDVPLGPVYGHDRLQAGGQLRALLVLNWRREAREPLTLVERRVADADFLMPAVMKCPGPFYCDAAGRFLSPGRALDAQPYRDMLKGLPIYEARGRVEFEQLRRLLAERRLAGCA